MSGAVVPVRRSRDVADGPRRRAAVIGSGFGGLAAAIRLQSMGFDTVCYEAHPQPGGRAGVYEDGGFIFDAGPTVITAPHCLEELFELSGRRMADYVRMLPVTPLYRLQWSDGVSFDYVADEAGLIEQVRRVSPRDVEGYRRFADYTRQVFEKGYEELGAVPFLSFTDMLRAAPHLARLRADRSVYAQVSRFVQDEHLRQAFSFHPLLVGGNPLDTSSIYTLIHWIERKWGVFFPAGGTGALVRGLVRLFEDLGGTLQLGAPVERVAVRTGPDAVQHVVHAVGLPAAAFDVVVSNADVHHTYATLYRGVAGADRRRRRLERMSWSMSLFVLYFGTNRRFPQLAHHTILFGPRFQGLVRDIFRGPRLPDDFSLYLHAPTVTDPGMAPAGCEAFYVLSPVPHLGHAAVDWEAVAAGYGDTILAALERRLPGLRQSIVTRRHFTPADFAAKFGAHHGSAFSVAPRLIQSAYFRPHNRDPDIPGLYLAGAGTHPGAGVPGVVNSAKATCDTIARDFHVVTG
ncbi:MAG: phytoene desaturase [Planctomycetia bacterium]|nr:phytoene desaturase [Planctomycetia bacterium]